MRDILPWITAGALLLGGVRYVWTLEARIQKLEITEQFMHGDVSQWTKR